MARKRSRAEKYPDNKYFKFYNANSHNHFTGDCVVRALCTATEQSWEDCATELFTIGLKYGYTMLEDNVIKRYLQNHDFIKCDEPRDSDNRKYRVCDWLSLHSHKSERIVANVGTRHIVAIVDNKVHDIWDSSKQTMHTYWVKV